MRFVLAEGKMRGRVTGGPLLQKRWRLRTQLVQQVTESGPLEIVRPGSSQSRHSASLLAREAGDFVRCVDQCGDACRHADWSVWMGSHAVR